MRPLSGGGSFFVGLSSAQLELLFFPSDHIALFTAADDRLADLQLRIVEPPHINIESAENRTLPPKQILTADVTAVETRTGWQAATGRVVVSVEPPLDHLAAGQIIRALGWLSRPETPVNPGQFDLASYDRRRRILADFRIRRAAGIQILSDPGPPPLVRIRQAARNLLAAGFSQTHALDAAFLRMLLLGDADPQLNDVREEFNLTGTAYQLSISGLHIAIVGGFVLLMLRLMRQPPARAISISMLVVALYAAVALPSQAGVRSLAVCMAGAVGLLLRRPRDGLQLLAAAVALILLLHPSDLYDPGFQIGAAAVLGLILFAGSAGGFIAGLWRSDEPLAGPVPEYGPMRFVARLAWRMILASAIIWVTVLPLLIYYFQQVSAWAVPGGFFLLPITTLALLAGAAKILLTLVCPWPAAWWAAGAAVPAELLRHVVAKLAAMPMNGIAASAPRWWMFVAYYAVLLLPLVPWRRAPVRWAARLAWIPACAMLLTAPPPAAAALFSPSPSGGVRVTFLDIGAGQTALVRVAGGENFFVDCGSTTILDVYHRAIQPYLQHEGIRRVDGIYLSHGDYDHICAAAEIIEAFNVPGVYLTPHFRRHAAPGAATALLELLDSRGPPPRLLAAGDSVNVGGGAKLLVLWPPVHCDMDSNNCGMVMKLIYAGKSILFTADIQVPPEIELLKHPALLKSDVMIAPHHGSAESSTLAFIRAVNPTLIICSNDRMLTHKQLTFDQIARPWPVYRTSDYGAIDLTVSGGGKIDVAGFTQTVAAAR